jgi:hypothetical protein
MGTICFVHIGLKNECFIIKKDIEGDLKFLSLP